MAQAEEAMRHGPARAARWGSLQGETGTRPAGSTATGGRAFQSACAMRHEDSSATAALGTEYHARSRGFAGSLPTGKRRGAGGDVQSRPDRCLARSGAPPFLPDALARLIAQGGACLTQDAVALGLLRAGKVYAFALAVGSGGGVEEDGRLSLSLTPEE